MTSKLAFTKHFPGPSVGSNHEILINTKQRGKITLLYFFHTVIVWVGEVSRCFQNKQLRTATEESSTGILKWNHSRNEGINE